MEKVEQLLDAAGFMGAIAPEDRVALKTHFGERGNTTYLRPELVRRVAAKVRRQEAFPFVTDTNARDSQTRSDAVRHLASAAMHGFTSECLGAPVLIADGLNGRDGQERGGYSVAGAIAHAQALVVLNHVTFHPVTGFAGCLHHLAFGGLTRQAKFELAIAGQLMTVGTKGKHDSTPSLPLAESVQAVVDGKDGKTLYVNYLLDITPDPDGVGWSDSAVVPDVGLMVSRDPVALDQATADFLNMQPGLPDTRLANPAAPDKIRSLVPDVDWQHLLKSAERLRLGTRTYELLII